MKRTPLKRKSWWNRNTATSGLRRVAITSSRTPLRRKTPMKKQNAARQAKRRKVYAAHLRSVGWLKLRAQAFVRDKGLCQCPECIAFRKRGGEWAMTAIQLWYDKRGGIHGFDTHHVTYARFGHELLSDVLTMIPAHHRKLEALTGMRSRFLQGIK